MGSTEVVFVSLADPKVKEFLQNNHIDFSKPDVREAIKDLIDSTRIDLGKEEVQEVIKANFKNTNLSGSYPFTS